MSIRSWGARLAAAFLAAGLVIALAGCSHPGESQSSSGGSATGTSAGVDRNGQPVAPPSNAGKMQTPKTD